MQNDTFNKSVGSLFRTQHLLQERSTDNMSESSEKKSNIIPIKWDRMLPFYGTKKIDLYQASSITINDAVSPSDLVSRLRASFTRGKTKSIEYRLYQLNRLLYFVEDNIDKIYEVEYKDLRKPQFETKCFEINILVNEIRSMISNLKDWAEPEKPNKPFANALDKLFIYNEPYGVVLVIGCWNYPLHLTLLPVVGAIAAGNCVVIKPSELSKATSNFIAETLPRYLDPECYSIYTGGAEETQRLLQEQFDYIFYTGSERVGKIVHSMATKYLTPITLELGGKSPVYIDKDINLNLVMKRVIWGKCVNAGQTCIAPDYILCSKSVQDAIIPVAQMIINKFYGHDVQASKNLCRIINDHHFERATNLLKGLKIAVGGRIDHKDRFIEPTIAINVNPSHPIMETEIFAPILPIIPVNSLNDAIHFINKRPKPLALYIFSKEKRVVDKILNETISGGVTVNDTLMHAAVDTLPFGGVGCSGMGAYHGKHSFNTFVHKRAVLMRSLDNVSELANKAKYPPYTETKLFVVDQGMKTRSLAICKCFLPLLLLIIGALIGAAICYIFINL